jgi:hypothetical protein
MRLRKIINLGLCLGLLLAAGSGLAQTPRPPTEYQIKAAILYNFAKFIDWPPEALRDDKAPFIIGILGDNPFGDDLEQTVAGKKINDHSILVQTFRKVADATHCQILFISKSEKKQFADILLSLHGTAVLTVSQTDGFMEAGGMVNLVLDPASRKIRFQINADAAKAARLKVSSKLLNVAVPANH